MSEPLLKPQAPVAPAVELSLDERLAPIARAVLRGAAKGLCCESGGFQAAELWLLDDATQSLRLAARWAKKGAAVATPDPVRRRPLAAAPADVAALAGGAVVLEEPVEALGWALHRPAGAGIGVPVSSDKTIHGVLWLLRDQPLTVLDGAVELAEVVAGRLALEVERIADGGWRASEPVAPSETKRVSHEPSRPASLPSAVAPPTGNAIVEPVEGAAWSAAAAEGLAWADCWELPGGRLAAIAAAAIDSPESTTASQRAAVEWLREEARRLAPRAADAGILLTLLNRRLIESPLAGEGLSVAAALIDAPEDAAASLGGAGTWAFAGPAVALRVRAAACETHGGDLVPLGWSEHEAAYAPRPFQLEVRERLVLVAGDPRLTSPLAERRLGDVYRAATADAHRSMTAEGCLRRLGACASDDVLAAVALRRN